MFSFEEISEITINEATKSFAPEYVVNESNYSIFKEYCKALDILATRLDATEFSVDVNKDKNISVSVTYPMVTMSNPGNLMNQLFHRSVELKFSYGKDSVIVDFLFPSIWEEAVYRGE